MFSFAIKGFRLSPPRPSARSAGSWLQGSIPSSGATLRCCCCCFSGPTFVGTAGLIGTVSSCHSTTGCRRPLPCLARGFYPPTPHRGRGVVYFTTRVVDFSAAVGARVLLRVLHVVAVSPVGTGLNHALMVPTCPRATFAPRVSSRAVFFPVLGFHMTCFFTLWCAAIKSYFLWLVASFLRLAARRFRPRPGYSVYGRAVQRSGSRA